MADTKITALTALTGADPANDVIPIVDVSDTTMAASGTTKKISVNNILGASGTATLASATITGDLTVDTSTLKVDSALNKVGVGVATLTGLQTFNVAGDVGITSDLVLKNSGGTVQGYIFGSSGLNYRVIAGQPHVWQEGGSDLMRLNSTGLGVGGSPSYKLSSIGTTNNQVVLHVGNTAGTVDGDTTNVVRFAAGSGANALWANARYDGFSHAWRCNSTTTEAMTLDASGNLLVGKTAVGFGTVGVESSSSGLLVATRSASTDGASATMMVYSTGAAAYRFYVGMGGTVFATNTTISAISDARLKENVQDIDVGLGAILALKPRKFDWKEGKGKNIKGDRGFIAQEFEQVFPQLVDEWKDPAPEGEAPYKSVRQDLIPVLVKAIQELTARVQTLETR